MTNAKAESKSHPPIARYFITSTDPKCSLVFVHSAELADYEHDLQEVVAKHRKIIRDMYGIWANNQNKFVTHESELGMFDSREFSQEKGE